MRVIGVVIAALMTLGLAAFGLVAAQKAAGPSPLITLAAHVVSPSQNSAKATPPAPANQVAPARVTQTPVVTEIPQPATDSQTNAAPAEPTVVSENNAAPVATAPATPAAPAASTNVANPPA